MSVRLTVQIYVQPGKQREFETIARAAAARVRAEDKGCEAYDLFRGLDDDTHYVLVESWATAEDLAAHGTSPAVADMRRVGPLLSGRMILHRYED
jgi:quinol monooxygenase YgiN